MADYSALIRRVAEAVEETAVARFARPTATYRLQFAPGTMTFGAAAALAPYLDALGASHLYGSPCLKSREGSSGYAIVDYGELNPALGGPQAYRTLVDELRRRGMGQILDLVPNHMSAVAGENRWWCDVLENGPSSPYAPYFDIDWSPVNEALEGKVLLPMLGDQYGKVLDAGDLKLEYREGSFYIRYYEMRLPLDPKSYRQILSLGMEEFRAALPADSEDLRELESIATALEHLPERTDASPAAIAERQREKEVAKDRLGKLTARSPEIAEFILRNVERFNGGPDDPRGLDRLDALLDAQAYRLCHWKAAADEINYRRFFDINELAAVCMEDPKVFEESHRAIFELLARGDADGLRIDHIDGLFDPQEYLNRLQLAYLRCLGREAFRQMKDSAPQAPTEGSPAGAAEWPGPEARTGMPDGVPLATSLPAGDDSASPPLAPEWKDLEPSFVREIGNRFNLEIPLNDLCFPAPAETVEIVVAGVDKSEKNVRPPLFAVVEKILGPEEPLPNAWLAAGTTGYEFANAVSGLFIDPAGFAELQKIYQRFIDDETIFREVAYQSKSLILRVAMSSDLQLLAHRLNRLSERHRHYRDFTLNELRTALREVIACFPVYRTYIRQGEVSEQDRQFICRAAAQAKRRNPARNPALFDFIRDVLLLEAPPDLSAAGIAERALFVGRFQQAASPVMAKGIEDTAFYRYCPLVSRCEVGGDPTRGATLPEEFHRQNLVRLSQWPQSLVCTSTHDTKRGEDARARIDVLSEIPAAWRAAINRWTRLNRRHRREVDGRPAPCRNDEYLFYQNLVGIWPPEPPDAETQRTLIERMQQYMEKATREAKQHTSWINPVAEYDAAVREFAAAALADHPKNRFLAEFRGFHEQIVGWGLHNALAQLALKLASPGVPDIYQGQELWDFSLVDPDNRRPVDFTLRQSLLARLEEAVGPDENSLLSLARELAANPRDPRAKLFVTWRMLQFRRRHADLFRHGEYIPLSVEGAASKHFLAFARRWVPSGEDRPQIALVAAPRLIAQLMKSATDIPPAAPPLGPAIWRDTRLNVNELGEVSLVNLFTGQFCATNEARLSAAEIFADFPVAVLVNSE
ncbi:MAG: malto-oligosyltrehalose synthase [Pirellulales bacterium]|nr:malto-oligosyltrehalose synthase [Pirellulales bacterium]